MNVRLKIQNSYHVEENQRHHKILMNPQTVALKRAKHTHQENWHNINKLHYFNEKIANEIRSVASEMRDR